eukprot:1446847-Ditylum_brightwellii.AAC.1
MSKQASDVSYEPNPHLSNRVEPGTDTRVEAGTGPPGEGDSNNGAPAIPSEEVGANVCVSDADPSSIIPSSNASKSIVEPVINANDSDSKVGGSDKSDEEENLNTTSETTGGFLETMEQEESSPHKSTSPTNKEENDATSVSEATTSPPGTPELIQQQRLVEKRDKNNNPNYPIIITDKTEYLMTLCSKI